jgi:hypothetical protein
MKPIIFEEQNLVYPAKEGPDGWDALPAHRVDGHMVLSVWEPTNEERIAIAEGGRVEISILAGGQQPPVAVNVYRVTGFIRSPSDETSGS